MKADATGAVATVLGLPGSVVRSEGLTALKLEETLIELYDAWRMSLYRYLVCTRIAGDEADDIIQETFFRLFQQLRNGERIDNLRAWVFRVAHNLGINEARSRKFVVPLNGEEWSRALETVLDPALGPEELVLKKERMTRLHDSISKLSSQQRQCLHLRTEGFRYREIAEILGVAIPTVSESLRRAVTKLTSERHD